ncbi:MAG: NUDIX domain-containing protein [Aquabacterium sp.]|nr:NUDIX domain-containing protein [Ferruginibacter sp.]
MPKKSAGLLLYRFLKQQLQVMLVHPGGPFWAKKDAGAWSIPKGEFDDIEEPLKAAIRETKEETGITVSGSFIELTVVKQKSGKLIYAWALQSDTDTSKIVSNTFDIEWPPKSGKLKSFPEIDKAQWFNLDEALVKIVAGQAPLLPELQTKLNDQQV